MIAFLRAILFSCAPKVAQVEKPQSGEVLTKEPPTVTKEAWEVEWEKTLLEARREGKLTVYTSTGPGVRQGTSEAFKSKTGLEIEFIAGRGPAIIPKLFTERRAGLYLADLYIGGTTPIVNMLKPAEVLAPLKPYLFLPEVIDPQGLVSEKATLVR